jgi:YVTN family beta-propeller protein
VPVRHARPSGIIVTADAVWVANGDATVVRIDPATKAVVATVKVGTLPQQGDVAPDGTIWIPNQTDDTISVIDPQTNTVANTVKLKMGTAPFVLRQGFGDMWVGSFRDRFLWRIRP